MNLTYRIIEAELLVFEDNNLIKLKHFKGQFNMQPVTHRSYDFNWLDTTEWQKDKELTKKLLTQYIFNQKPEIISAEEFIP